MSHFSTSVRVITRITFMLAFMSMQLCVRAQLTLACANSTTAASSITSNSAVSGGNICAVPEQGTITSRGLCWATYSSPEIGKSGTFSVQSGSGSGSFSVTLTGLTSSTLYYMRSYAVTTIGGTIYGPQLAFTTNALQTAVTMEALRLPTVKTRNSIIGSSFINSGGLYIDSGNTRITAKGVVWSTAQNPTVSLPTKTNDGTGDADYLSYITGLTPNTTYFVRAYATNKAGTAYGEQLSYTTPSTVKDASGNNYPVVRFRFNSEWMTENLRTTKYSDGSNIPLVSDSVLWANNYTNNTKLPMMCWYNNNQSTYSSNKFGALYNGYVIDTSTNGNKNVCPTGWHVATQGDWGILAYYLQEIYRIIPNYEFGEAMMSTGTAYWKSPNSDATNFSGLSGLPGGFRNHTGEFRGIMQYGMWLSVKPIYNDRNLTAAGKICYNLLEQSPYEDLISKCFEYYQTTVPLSSYDIYNRGCSIRCVKD